MSKKHKHKNKCYCDCNNSYLMGNYNSFILLGLTMLLCEALECIYDTRKPESALLDISIEDKCRKNDKKEEKSNIINKSILEKYNLEEETLKKLISKENVFKEGIINEDITNEDISKECTKNDSNIDTLGDILDSGINNDNNIDVADISNDNNSDVIENISTSDISNDNNIDVVEDISISDINDYNNIVNIQSSSMNKDNIDKILPSSAGDNLEEKGKISEKIIQNTSEKKSNILFSKSTVYSTISYQCNYNQGIEHYLSIKPSIADIPVVLSKFKMEIFIESLINLPEPVFEVKSLDKKVILEECELITGTNKLFIKGLLQENIEYATVNCIKSDRISGDIKKLTISIPFECSTKVHFSNNPQLPKVDKIEIKILQANKNYENIIEKNYGDLRFPRNKVFCDLDSTEMLETNNKEEMKLIKNTLINTYSFQIIRKKVILTLGLSLLQNQSTFIYNSSFNNAEEIEKAEKKVDTYMDNENDIEK